MNSITHHHNKSSHQLIAKKKPKHDSFVKLFLQEKRLAETFLRTYLPDSVIEIIDFATLQLASEELVTSAMKRLRCDTVLQCRLNQGEGWFYFTIEHQSSPDRLMALRIREYTTLLMRRHLKQGNETLPLIWPLVIYHGAKSPYPFTTSILDLFDDLKLARKWMLKPFQLIDLSAMSDNTISSHGTLAAIEWLLRDASIKGEGFLDRVKQHLVNPVYRDLMENFHDFRVTLFVYILSVYRGTKSADEVVDELIKAIPEEKNIMQSAAQQLEQRGMQQEKQQVAKRMLAKGMALEDIEELTGLSDDELAKLH